MMQQLLLRIVRNRELTALFQPIIHLQHGAILGYEGLIRGPADTPLRAPLALLDAARTFSLSNEVEALCRKVVVDTFVKLDLPGRLFLKSARAAWSVTMWSRKRHSITSGRAD
jgi:EAL domain-containing protein (putative c-di-GMP-specific phosphodiesterase class I)